jgi:peptidoglycan/xylan/chitin deacetylase (PgdA/CDA1 family)
VKSVRSGVKRAVETALVVGGGAHLVRRKRSGQLVVLAYHNIVPAGSEPVGDRSLHLTQAAFAEQLDALLDTHDVIPLCDAFTQHGGNAVRGRARPRAVITFDDAYAGALTAGVEELRARDLPATIFITPAFLDGKSFWWDVLSDATTGLDEALRERALSEGRGLTTDTLVIARSMGLSPHEMPVHARGASIADLDAALAHGGISLAAHTWNHPNLTTISDAELKTELSNPLEWLERFGDRALPMISYPYGLADYRVHDAASDAGYAGGFRIDGGWAARVPKNPFAIPRLNVPAGVSRDGFVLRAAGLVQG